MTGSDSLDSHKSPASDWRPDFGYRASAPTTTLISVLMPYYNMGPMFEETVRSLQRMSIPSWECIVVDDGSTDQSSIAQLARVAGQEPRIRVMSQANAGPGVARNLAFSVARGEYLLQLDCDDLVEPTFAEKAIWFLERNPQFGACGSWVMTFGTQNYEWRHGFDAYDRALIENPVTNIAVIRRSAWLAAGGYDPSADRGHEDWDFWLNMAEVGEWGYTLPEILAWYRRLPLSRLTSMSSNREASRRFQQWLIKKHAGLARRFPHPLRTADVDQPHAKVEFNAPFRNPLTKPVGVKRVLCIYPWLEIGGADKFNIDMIRQLAAREYQFTIVTNQASEQPWLQEFRGVTPDIFCLDTFLSRADYPRFLDYLIESREIDAILLSNSAFGYMLLPYLRAQHPQLPILDYNHMEEEWNGGGHPANSLRAGGMIDLRVVCTDHLKQWMVERQGDASRIQVVYCCLDTTEWQKDGADVAKTRATLNISSELPVILFVGRMVQQKRPMEAMKIVHALVQQGERFVAVFVGAGPDLDAVKAYARKHHLDPFVRFLGAQPNERVRQLMAASDILLQPSEQEGLALVLYEAMAMGLVPVIADVGGHSELVSSRDFGYLIPRGEKDDLSYIAAIASLLHDPIQRSDIAQRAISRVRKHFDLRRMASDMDNAFHRAFELAQARNINALSVEERSAAHYSAHLAVETARLQELADNLWSEREISRSGKFRIPLRRRILPYDTRRYAVWKYIRATFETPARLLVIELLRYRALAQQLVPTPALVQATKTPASLAQPVDPASLPAANSEGYLDLHSTDEQRLASPAQQELEDVG